VFRVKKRVIAGYLGAHLAIILNKVL